MEIKLTIEDSQKDRVINALCYNYKYEEVIDGKINPETKSQFAKKQIIMFLKEHTKAYETEIATDQVKTTIKDDIIIN